jgi:hypothetical protein
MVRPIVVLSLQNSDSYRYRPEDPRISPAMIYCWQRISPTMFAAAGGTL